MWKNASRVLLVIHAAALGVVAAPQTAMCDRVDNRAADSICGPACLKTICDKLGVPATIEELSKLSGCNEGRVTALSGLVKAARAKGLYAVAMKVSLEELMAAKVPAIVYTWEAHYVVVEAKDEDTLRVTDPPDWVGQVPKDVFKNGYSGFVVFLSTDQELLPKPTSLGPDIRFAEYRWDFGDVYAGESVTHAFVFRNAGDSDLRIAKADLPTVALGALYPTEVIAPRKGGKLEVVLDTTDLSGWQEWRIGVKTNDPAVPISVITMMGYVRPNRLAFAPDRIDFGVVRHSSSSSRTIYVPSHERDPVRIRSVTSNSRFVVADAKPSAIKGLLGYLVNVGIKRGVPIGNLNATVLIRTNHPKQPNVEVPITSIIAGDIAANPSSFCFGIVNKEGTVQAYVTLRNAAKKPLKIRSVACDLPCIVTKIVPTADAGACQIAATLNTAHVTGNLHGVVVARTEDAEQPEVRIPVHAFVKE